MNDFNTPLIAAARAGDAAEVARLISDTPSWNTVALEKAAERGHVECVKILIPVSQPAENDSFALWWAAEKGHTECVRLLIPVSDMTRCQALKSAANYGHTACVELLKDVSNLNENAEALCLAAGNNHIECVRLLLTVMDAKWGNQAALFSALQKGYAPIVELLLPYSDPNAENGLPMWMALRNADSACIDLLYPYADIEDLRQTIKHHQNELKYEQLLNEAQYRWEAKHQHTVLRKEIQGVAPTASLAPSRKL